MKRTGTSSAPSRRAPQPYELYTRLQQIEASWPSGDAVVLVAGYQAGEICWRLIEEALADDRPWAYPGTRVARVVDVLADGIAATHRAVVSPAGTVAESVRTGPPLRSHDSGFVRLPDLRTAQVQRVLGAFRLDELPFGLGIEHHLLAAAPGYGDMLQADRGPTVPYDELVRPAFVRGLHADPANGPEDVWFRSGHQIAECWLRIATHQTEQARLAAVERNWRRATDRATLAAEAVRLASAGSQLLDLMNLADFHPLRVRLREGSGAQSRAAHAVAGSARLLLEPLQEHLSQTGLTLRGLMDRSSEHVAEYEYLLAVRTAAQATQSFLFEHYLLVMNVLGKQTRGTLGYEVDQLGRRAVQPLLPELNQAQHDLAMVMSLRHAAVSGTVTDADDRAGGVFRDPPVPDPVPCPKDVMVARVTDYFACIESRDATRWVELFEPRTGRLTDIPGTRPYVGKHRLRVFIDAVFEIFSDVRARYRFDEPIGNTIRVEWWYTVTTYLGTSVRMDGWETFAFRSDGVLLQAEAGWRPDEVAGQLWEG